MLTGLFAKRYREPMIWSSDGMPRNVAVLLRQLAHILFGDVRSAVPNAEDWCAASHDRVARELGVFTLERGKHAVEICQRYLATPWDLWNDTHGNQDTFFKNRISLVEVMMREAEASIGAPPPATSKAGSLAKALGVRLDKRQTALTTAIDEMNARFRESGVNLHYHSGVIQRADDPLTAKHVSDPFWEITRVAKWANVDADIKEAVDRRDAGGRDAALYALKAVESTIKIISDEKGLTRGTEKGAANYIDNLVSAKNGRIIEVWEGDALKMLFGSVRNPHGHGPGSAPMPTLSAEQQDWVIESAMSWIKSLIRRS